MTAALQRAQGELNVGLRRAEDGNTRVFRLFQQGCLQARLPRSFGGEAELVMLNTAGGLTGGDRLSVELGIAEGGQVTATTPGCEHIYRSLHGTAEIRHRFRVGRSARFDWLPQETILYERSRLRRRLAVELEADAEITILEAILFGRAAMGESLTDGFLSDVWTVRRGSRLAFADAVRIAESFGPALAWPSTLHGQRAMATVLHAGAGLRGKRDALRAAFAGSANVTAGASVIDQILVARLAAPRGSALRRTLIAALRCLRHPRPLPSFWIS